MVSNEGVACVPGWIVRTRSKFLMVADLPNGSAAKTLPSRELYLQLHRITRALVSTIDYHAPFDRGFNPRPNGARKSMIVDDSFSCCHELMIVGAEMSSHTIMRRLTI